MLCSICGKEMLPTIIKIDENNYESNLFTGSIRCGIGNKEIARCCEKCYKELKEGIFTIKENIIKYTN